MKTKNIIMLKRTMSVLLAAVLIFGSAPIGALLGLGFSDLFEIKASAATYSGTCGENLTWSLDTKTGKLVISGTGDMTDWSDYTDIPWIVYMPYIETVTIENGVTSIGSIAFAEYESLTSVTIGNSVTSIGYGAFADCYNLASLTIPDSVTSIGDEAFIWCESLNGVTIPYSVQSIGAGAFAYCENLVSVIIGNGVMSIGEGAFHKCTSLKSVIISDSVMSIGEGAFYNTEYYKNTFNWENDVLYIGKHLIEAKPSIGGAYTIKNGTLTIADGAFWDCIDLTSVTIPDSVKSIGNYAFEDCESLNGVTIPDSVTSIGYLAFDNTEYYNNESNWENDVLYIGKHLIEVKPSISGAYTIKDNTLTVAGAAFYECTNLQSVKIPGSVMRIGDYAFYECESLTDVYYKDARDQWEKISIGSFNESLTNATIHYREIVDVVVKGDSVKTEYIYKKDNIDISGVELEIIYSDGTKDIIKDTSKMTVSGFSNEKKGEQSVTVEYEGLKAEYKVTVKYTWWQWILVILLFGWIWY